MKTPHLIALVTRPDVEDAHLGPSGWVVAISETELLVCRPPGTSADINMRGTL
jgi:hypothetical protein